LFIAFKQVVVSLHFSMKSILDFLSIFKFHTPNHKNLSFHCQNQTIKSLQKKIIMALFMHHIAYQIGCKLRIDNFNFPMALKCISLKMKSK